MTITEPFNKILLGNIIGAFVKGLGLSNPSFDGSLSSNRDLRDKESFGAT